MLCSVQQEVRKFKKEQTDNFSSINFMGLILRESIKQNHISMQTIQIVLNLDNINLFVRVNNHKMIEKNFAFNQSDSQARNYNKQKLYVHSFANSF
ncbi:hypothetical protein BpHYR1_053007 [Brachionus plicatilis]|uniref:Uncharacterized protein n=1 Tax=Brachionus plicatilis TaxID=10195 RepID=A0A3M7SAN4_BRAPC|nr:hypothetical protein BpHYR1_053007 [Brachionus plicatilis]